MRKRTLRWLIPLTALAIGAVVGTHTVNAAQASDEPTNPDQAFGPGIMSVEQTNMCMWGSQETADCFPNSLDPEDEGWAEEERAVAQKKRQSLITQYERHLPDVITVAEGCLEDLRTVADEIGYQLRYEHTGAGTDGVPRQCTVDRGDAVNAILAENFTGDGPQGYYQDEGYRSYVCAQVSTSEWQDVLVCTSHLSLPHQEPQPLECEMLRDDVLGTSSGPVIFAGDVNMKGSGEHCAPSGFHGLKNLEREGGTPQAGLQHIYYSANGFWRQSCGWSYDVADTDHKGFLLELGDSEPDETGDCWRDITD